MQPVCPQNVEITTPHSPPPSMRMSHVNVTLFLLSNISTRQDIIPEVPGGHPQHGGEHRQLLQVDRARRLPQLHPRLHHRAPLPQSGRHALVHLLQESEDRAGRGAGKGSQWSIKTDLFWSEHSD